MSGTDATREGSPTPPNLRGALTALVTPWREGQVDFEKLEATVERQLEGGIDGLVPCGTTGESATMTPDEQQAVIEAVVKKVGGRVPVLAGAGSNDTHKAIELSHRAHEAGADATLQVCPYYNKPSQAGMVRHFEAIAEASELPLVLYNVPGRTVSDLQASTVSELAQHPKICGIKEATGDMHRAAQIRESCGEDFALLSGDDFSLLPFLSIGGDGVVSVVSNLWPTTLSRLCAAVRSGDLEKARALHFKQLALTRLLFAAPNPVPTKALLAEWGLCRDEVRLPLLALQAESDAELLRALRAFQPEPAGPSGTSPTK